MERFDDTNPFAAPLATNLGTEGDIDTEVEQIRREHLSHEASIKSVGFLYILGAVFLGITFLVMTISLATAITRGIGLEELAIAGGFALLYGVLSFAGVWVGLGLRRLDPAARTPGMVLAAIGLLGFPIGTLINAYILGLLASKKGKYILSQPYQEVVRQTPHIKYKTSIVVWIFLALLVVLLILGAVSWVGSGR